MSLAVGTLVMIVHAPRVPEMHGKVGEIVGPLAVRKARGIEEMLPRYLVRFPGCPDENGSEIWVARPHQIIPLTPPPGTVDVTTDLPLSEAA